MNGNGKDNGTPPTPDPGALAHDSRAPQDPLSAWVAESGGRLLLTVNGLAQVLKFYEANNQMVKRFFDDIEQQLGVFFEVADVPLLVQVTADTFFINGQIVRLDFGDFSKMKQLTALLLEAGVGQAIFPPETRAENLVQLFVALREAAGNAEASQQLVSEGVGGIKLLAAREGASAVASEQAGSAASSRGGQAGTAASQSLAAAPGRGVGVDRHELLLRLYMSLVNEGNRLVEAVEADRSPDLVKVHRTLRLLAEQTKGGESLLVGLISSPWGGSPLGRHCAHVAILATLLGQRLGLATDALMELSMAGFLHDVARVLLARRLPHPMTDLLFLPEEQRKVLLRVPEVAVQKMMAWQGAGPLLRSAMMVVYENRLDFSATQLYDSGAAPHPYTQLLGVVDRYDSTLLSSPGAPAQAAIDLVVKQAGKRFEPTLTAAMVKCLGAFPPCTPVLLTSGDTGVVIHQGSDAARTSTPVVFVVETESGKFEPGQVVDLAETDEAAVQSLPRNRFGPRLRTWFLACCVSTE